MDATKKAASIDADGGGSPCRTWARNRRLVSLLPSLRRCEPGQVPRVLSQPRSRYPPRRDAPSSRRYSIKCRQPLPNQESDVSHVNPPLGCIRRYEGLPDGGTAIDRCVQTGHPGRGRHAVFGPCHRRLAKQVDSGVTGTSMSSTGNGAWVEQSAERVNSSDRLPPGQPGGCLPTHPPQ